MKPILALSLLLVPTMLSAAPSAPRATDALLANPDGRSSVSLDGRWKVIVDPLSSGDASPVAAGVEGSGFYQDQKPESPLDLIEYRFSNSNQLTVPGDWNSQSERLFFYEGPVWYRTTFQRPAAACRTFLYFGAVNYAADIYVNGRYVASHRGGYTPFDVDVTDRLRNGENLLVVKADNSLGSDTIPTRKTDWLNYGGITRSVRLIKTPSAYIQDYVVRLIDWKTRTIEVAVTTKGGRAGDRMTFELPALHRRVAVTLGANGAGKARFSAPVALWSPDRPQLYDVRLSYGSDTIRDRIGFRTIAVRGNEILLNGQPIFLRGIAAHEESPLHPGRSSGAQDARATLGLAKSLGANFIRLSHYPHDEATTRMADEMGLLVWSEIPVYWSVDFKNPSSLSTARSQLTEMIARDHNRASVIVWSVANETPMGPDRLAFLKDLVATTRRLDPSRLVSAALFGDPFGFLKTYSAMLMAQVAVDPTTGTGMRQTVEKWFRDRAKVEPTPALLAKLTGPNLHIVDDPIGDDVDIVAYNEYFGWYYSGFLAKLLPVPEAVLRRAEFAAMKGLEIEPRQDKPFIISEFGADAKAGFLGDDETVFSERYQARLYAAQLAMISRSRKLRGISPWVLKDFRSALRTHPDYQQYYNRKGLFDEHGKPKLAAQVLRVFYTARSRSRGKDWGLRPPSPSPSAIPGSPPRR